MTTTTTRDSCNAVTQHCRATPDEPTLTTCFACGMAACKACTAVLPRYYRWRRKRVCHDCLVDHGFGDIAARLIWERAGYTGPPPDDLLRAYKWNPDEPVRTWSLRIR